MFWPNFYLNTVDYGFWPNFPPYTCIIDFCLIIFNPNTTHSDFLPNFHHNATGYVFWPNFHPNTTHSDFWSSFYPTTRG